MPAVTHRCRGDALGSRLSASGSARYRRRGYLMKRLAGTHVTVPAYHSSSPAKTQPAGVRGRGRLRGVRTCGRPFSHAWIGKRALPPCTAASRSARIIAHAARGRQGAHANSYRERWPFRWRCSDAWRLARIIATRCGYSLAQNFGSTGASSLVGIASVRSRPVSRW